MSTTSQSIIHDILACPTFVPSDLWTTLGIGTCEPYLDTTFGWARNRVEKVPTVPLPEVMRSVRKQG